MEKKEGSCRTAYVGEKYTVKIPEIKLAIATLRFGIKCYRHGGWQSFRRWLSQEEEAILSLRGGLRGIFENLREILSSNDLEGIVVPTRLSIGLINIMPTAEPVESVGIDDENMYERIFKILMDEVGYDIVKQDRHGFANPNNYGVSNGEVRLLDYGGRKANSILLKHREAFRRALVRISSHQT